MNIKHVIFECKDIKGVISVCSSNPYVIKAAMRKSKENGIPVLIEATANQVDQFGGYSGMTPDLFRDFVYYLAESMDFSKTNIILGGDHLGPLTWRNKSEVDAMALAENLVKAYVSAGFSKIHIDCSMRLKDDSRYLPLSDEKIARRAVRLIKACESVRTQDVSYVVGSEVPIPGGTTAGESELKVTLVKDIKDTISHLQSELNIYGIGHVMEDIVGIVVQPGVEFGDNEIHHYDRSKTIDLAHYISTQKRLVYEGHSTDYQLKENLRKMIEDGIRILKVGPALTFYFREAVYALENIEKEYAFEQPSKIRDIYEKEMIEHPEKWKDYYFGSEIDMVIKRHFSYCDRIRYYSNYQEVQDAMKRLLNNLSMVNIPISLISQYFPNQSCRILSGAIKATPEDLILDKIGDILDDYYYAIS